MCACQMRVKGGAIRVEFVEEYAVRIGGIGQDIKLHATYLICQGCAGVAPHQRQKRRGLPVVKFECHTDRIHGHTFAVLMPS